MSWEPLPKSIKTFSLGENLAYFKAVHMSKIVHKKSMTMKFVKFPDVVALCRKIAEIRDDQFQQLIIRLTKNSKFAIQLLGYTTYVSHNTQLLLHVW